VPKKQEIANMRIIITDAELRIALYVIKSLGKRGYHTLALSEKKDYRYKSNYAKEKLLFPSWKKDKKAWIEFVLSQEADVLIPIGIETIEFISQFKKDFIGKIALPDINDEALRIIIDKKALLKSAQIAGLNIPKTYEISSLEKVDSIKKDLEYPVVIKMRKEECFAAPERYKVVFDAASFKYEYNMMHSIQPFPIVQKYIEGEGIGFSGIFNQDKLVSGVGHIRLRELPITGGPSTYCRIWKDRKIEEHTINLMKAVGWNGIAMTEFKYNKVENKYYLMEINPRFWGTAELAIKAGIDIPYLYLQWIIGESIEQTNQKIRKISLKFLELDVKASYEEWKRLKGFFCKTTYMIRYVCEYLDFRLRIGIIDFFDFRLTIREFARVFYFLLSVIKSEIKNVF